MSYRRPNAKPPLGSQINWSHPLTRGLVQAFLFNENAGAPYDLVRHAGTSIAGTAASGTIAWDASSGGLGLKYPENAAVTGTQYVSATAPTLSTTASIVARLALVESTPVAGKNTGFMSTQAVEPDNSHYPYSDGSLYIGVLNGTRQSLGDNSGFDKTVPHQIAVTASEDANEWKFYQNGAQFGSTGSCAAASVSGVNHLWIGASKDATTYTFHGTWYHLYFYNIVLPQESIAQLATDPYAFIYQPSSRRRHFVRAAAVAQATARRAKRRLRPTPIWIGR